MDELICAYCGARAEGTHAIHRDGFGEGPEVPLCTKCGQDPEPTCEEIWARIAKARKKLLEGIARG